MAPPMWGDKARTGKTGERAEPPPGGFRAYKPVDLVAVAEGTKALARGPPPGIDVGVGDWPCPNSECGNWNWAKRNECNKCFARHPNRPLEQFKPTKADVMQDRRAGLDTARKYGTGNGSREGSSGGYREVDDEALRQNKRRREEEKEHAEKRKATGVKCKCCKRFKCIC